MRKNLFLSALLSFVFLALAACSSGSEKDKAVVEYAKKNNLFIKSNNMKNADPSVLFCYSSHLWQEGQKDEAVFWYYVAQYRYRILSSCSEPLKAGSFTEVAGKDILLKTGVYESKEDLDKLHLIGGIYSIELYEVIQKKFGATINSYAYGDLEKLKSTISQVLEYEKNYPFDPMGLEPQPILKSKEIQDEKLAKVKESYANQIKELTEKADYIKSERTKNGLENR